MAKIYVHDEAYGKRENARSVVILITDGLSNKNSDYTKQVRMLIKRLQAQLGSPIMITWEQMSSPVLLLLLLLLAGTVSGVFVNDLIPTLYKGKRPFKFVPCFLRSCRFTRGF